MRHLIYIYARKTELLMLLCLMSLHIQAAQKWDLKVSDNNRFLCYTDGTPFFWLGDTGWLLPTALDRGSAKTYLMTAHEQGYNVVQVQTISSVPAINAYGQMSSAITAQDGHSWTSTLPKQPFSSLNQGGQGDSYGYWDHMDYIIKEAERQGIYIAMDCIWGGLVKSGAIDVEGAKAYGTFLANRYKDSPNIIWMIGGDIQGDIKTEVWDAMARAIKSIDHRHLMTYHPRGRYTSAKWWSKTDWIDFHMYQSGHRTYGQRLGNKEYSIPDSTEEDCWMYVDSTWSYKPIKPVIDGEPSYEHIPIGLHFPDGPQWQASDVRRYAYWDVFAGCFGHTYGNNAIMQMHTPGHAGAYARYPENWYDAQCDSGYVQMKYLKALILAFSTPNAEDRRNDAYFDRIPDQSIIYKNQGTRHDRLIATRGKDYLLVYDYTSRPVYVNLKSISGKKKNVWWMDCQTGKLEFFGEYDDGKYEFSIDRLPSDPPVTDRVLIAIDADKPYITKDQQNILFTVGRSKKDMTE